MTIRVDRKVNLVFPFEQENGSTIHVFASPVGAPILHHYYLVIAKMWTAMASQGLLNPGGARIAREMLEDVARATPRDTEDGNWWDGPTGVENGFLGEIRRLTMVLAPGGNGWETIQFGEAMKRGLFSEEEVGEIEGAIVFFTVNWRMLRARVREGMVASVGRTSGWQISSSSISEYRNSLPTLTPAATSEPKAKPSPMIR